jgi:hypothetical protein
MKRIVKLIKDNWSDPVWSKVVAGLILALLGGIAAILVALWKKIPISEIYDKSVNNYITVSYFTIFISFVLLLAIIIPAIYTDVIKFQLKNIKFPSKLNTKKFNLQQFLTGQWHLVYEQGQLKSNESVTFLNGNQYHIENKLTFVMTDIQFDENKKELLWTKTHYTTNQKHARETLQIIDEKTMSGSDDLGFSLIYTKT